MEGEEAASKSARPGRYFHCGRSRCIESGCVHLASSIHLPVDDGLTFRHDARLGENERISPYVSKQKNMTLTGYYTDESPPITVSRYYSERGSPLETLGTPACECWGCWRCWSGATRDESAQTGQRRAQVFNCGRGILARGHLHNQMDG